MKKIKLNDGNEIPELGFGVYLIWDHNQCVDMVLKALNAGYRLIDTASAYKNEKAVGEAIKKSNIPREEIFVTTKVWINDNGYEKTKKAVENSLNNLGLDYIDLMLIHIPVGDYIGAWKALEEAKESGKIKSIGISNFKEKDFNKILSTCKIKPVINQIECHPYYQRTQFKKYMKEHNVLLQAWSPLGHGNKKVIQNKTIEEIAKKYNKSVAQIILRWHLQLNHLVIPKTINEEHLKENLNIYDFELSDEDMETINKLDNNKTLNGFPSFLEKPLYALLGKLPFYDKLLR